ncbi:MAG TPA: hypothetical protein VN767_11975 [Streptosporangiaceae bacterium]|nr:hypothetical protein [Streptosporangiaceae bacterium]
MSSMDSPHRQRPLAGVDQALGEGHARQPTELLDQLRERLSRLDANHPSAPPWQADRTVTDPDLNDEPNADDKAEPAASPDESPGQDVLQDVAADAHRQRRPEADRHAGREDSGGSTADTAKNSGSLAEETSRGWSDDNSESSNAPDQARFEAHPGWERRPVYGDPYRPWFAADEPITPWFAE